MQTGLSTLKPSCTQLAMHQSKHLTLGAGTVAPLLLTVSLLTVSRCDLHR